MAKLYQLLLKKVGLWKEPPKPVEKAEEEKVYNPIGVKVGGVVKIDALDLREHRFTCKEIRELTVALGGKNYRMVDYVLLSRPIGKEDFRVRLRLIPDDDSRSTVSHRSLVLQLYDELAYDEGLHNVVNDSENKNFKIDDDSDPNNPVHDEFWRVNDVGSSYTADVKVLADEDGNGKVDANEVSSTQVEFWDYSRMTDVEGVETEEFVFVEMNKSDGWFQIWRGAEVNAARIDVF